MWKNWKKMKNSSIYFGVRCLSLLSNFNPLTWSIFNFWQANLLKWCSMSSWIVLLELSTPRKSSNMQLQSSSLCWQAGVLTKGTDEQGGKAAFVFTRTIFTWACLKRLEGQKEMREASISSPQSNKNPIILSSTINLFLLQWLIKLVFFISSN